MSLITPESFLNSEEEQQIKDAILKAERETSGEIRVHISSGTEVDFIKAAQEIFMKLGMQNTKYRNGVLFHITVKEHGFAIIGDEGIDKATPEHFWEDTRDVVISHFKKNEFAEGLIRGILKAGQALKEYFPYEEGDINELPNEISKD